MVLGRQKTQNIITDIKIPAPPKQPLGSAQNPYLL